jgi:hypothetical protein
MDKVQLKELSSLSSALAELDERGDNESVTKMLTLISREEAQANKAKSPDLPKILLRLHGKIAALDVRGDDEEITSGLTIVHRANERVNSADYKGAPTPASSVEEKYQGEIAAILARMPNRPKEAREMATMLTTKNQRSIAEKELAESESDEEVASPNATRRKVVWSKLYDFTKDELLGFIRDNVAKGNKRHAEDLRWALKAKQDEEAKANGTSHWSTGAGYTGRQSNRR